jgi:transcription-repair coupling factor (superfamily II helicase)
MLSKDIKFTDLGLWWWMKSSASGCATKSAEADAKEVDVLTMSATPIPRTLHMSLSACAT